MIGLGRMGSALAASLLATGYSVVCFDIRSDLALAMKRMGAEVAEDARALATVCDVVLTFLPGRGRCLTLRSGRARRPGRPRGRLRAFGYVDL